MNVCQHLLRESSIKTSNFSKINPSLDLSLALGVELAASRPSTDSYLPALLQSLPDPALSLALGSVLVNRRIIADALARGKFPEAHLLAQRERSLSLQTPVSALVARYAALATAVAAPRQRAAAMAEAAAAVAGEEERARWRRMARIADDDEFARAAALIKTEIVKEIMLVEGPLAALLLTEQGNPFLTEKEENC
jgi:hypothetical protein